MGFQPDVIHFFTGNKIFHIVCLMENRHQAPVKTNQQCYFKTDNPLKVLDAQSFSVCSSVDTGSSEVLHLQRQDLISSEILIKENTAMTGPLMFLKWVW